jgi:hypothetical protein
MHTPRVIRAAIPGLAALLLVGALPVRAAAADAPSRLSLLTPCGGATPSEAEERLRSELELALDGFDIVVVDPGRADFPALPENEQIDVIRRATSNASDTSPVLWLECDIGERPAARLLVTEGGVGLVRVIGGESLEEIALVVQELLRAAPPPPAEPEPAPDDTPVDEPVKDEQPVPEQPLFAVGVLSVVELDGGLVGQVGSSLLGGAGLGVDGLLAIGFFGRLTLLGKFGPRAEDDEFLILGQRIELRVELGYLWRAGRFAVGPVVGLTPFVSFLDFAMSGVHHQREHWWSVRYSGGVDSRWRLTERLSVALDLTIGFAPSKRFFRLSTKETLLKTPTMDLAGMLGLIVRI